MDKRKIIGVFVIEAIIALAALVATATEESFFHYFILFSIILWLVIGIDQLLNWRKP